jgi:hypothetical protein
MNVFYTFPRFAYLPIELQNIICSYLPPHPIKIIMDEVINEIIGEFIINIEIGYDKADFINHFFKFYGALCHNCGNFNTGKLINCYCKGCYYLYPNQLYNYYYSDNYTDSESDDD